MEINHPEGIIAVVLGFISFFGMTYVVIALNVGWRFGYWLASATLGAVMVLLSIFWIVTGFGPRGLEPRWVPVGSDAQRVTQVTVQDEVYTSPGQYPGGPWEAPADEDLVERFESAVSSCLDVDPEDLPALQQEACATAQALLPPPADIPVLEGVEVAFTPELLDLRFAEEGGRLLGQATVAPLTRDPRVADDPVAGEALGPEFLIVGMLDPGSLRQPAYGGLVVSLVFFAFHLWGLHRAEMRKLSPAA